MRARLLLVAVGLALTGGVLGCPAFGTSDGAPADPDAGVDAADASLMGDASEGAEASAQRCNDVGPAQAYCKLQKFCDDFEVVDGGEAWTPQASGGGAIAYDAGRTGRGFVSRLAVNQESRARLIATIDTTSVSAIDLDFDVRTTAPSFNSEGQFVDLVKIMTQEPFGDEPTGLGLGWTPGGFTLFSPFSPDSVLQLPSTTCAWRHLHLTVSLETGSTRLDVTIDGTSVTTAFSVGVMDVPSNVYVAFGGWTNGVPHPVEMAFDNVSVGTSP